mmetsp:Transcript_21147/g.43283  ORF Transcript_21147/g.43283 Transcript_21147/m.43283 type:complete len:82 (-) Transcript_21147:131-376(-)
MCEAAKRWREKQRRVIEGHIAWKRVAVWLGSPRGRFCFFPPKHYEHVFGRDKSSTPVTHNNSQCTTSPAEKKKNAGRRYRN